MLRTIEGAYPRASCNELSNRDPEKELDKKFSLANMVTGAACWSAFSPDQA